MQCCEHLLLIRPVNFGFNAETAVNNSFQVNSTGNVQQKALIEFDGLVSLLAENKVSLTVIADTEIPHTPDSIFPNNWISFHEDGTVIIYPMFAANRRLEKKPHILDKLKEIFHITTVKDLSRYETKNLFLEGTGSMVLDRENRIAYASLSPRTDKHILDEFCSMAGYTPCSFTSMDNSGNPIYHTNVMMCVAANFAVICLEAIRDEQERLMVSGSLTGSGKEIIGISLQQMNAFAGNMLQVRNSEGELLLVMSSQAFDSLNKTQVSKLEKFSRIIHTPLDTIESCGGGSARCMMAEIFNKNSKHISF
ncbi:MAG: amidinotransferase [Ferruginibacter sp.]|nr:amidinotransferase [Ferruginibacter sp.]